MYTPGGGDTGRQCPSPPKNSDNTFISLLTHILILYHRQSGEIQNGKSVTEAWRRRACSCRCRKAYMQKLPELRAAVTHYWLWALKTRKTSQTERQSLEEMIHHLFWRHPYGRLWLAKLIILSSVKMQGSYVYICSYTVVLEHILLQTLIIEPFIAS